MKILLLYSTHDGQTEKIINYINRNLISSHETHCQNIITNPSVPLDNFDAIVIATSIRYGFYHKKIKSFILNNKEKLSKKTTAFIGVNLVARKPNKNTAETNSYTRKFLENVNWTPTISTVFAGALYYPKYNFLDRIMIQLIMWMGKGETNTKIPVVEYTDWNRVDQFIEDFNDILVESNKD